MTLNKAKHRYSIKFDHFYFKLTLTVVVTTATREPKRCTSPTSRRSCLTFTSMASFSFRGDVQQDQKIYNECSNRPRFCAFWHSATRYSFRGGVSHGRIFVRERSFIIRNISRRNNRLMTTRNSSWSRGASTSHIPIFDRRNSILSVRDALFNEFEKLNLFLPL